LKSNKDVTLDEKITLGVNVTISGLPEDSIFIGNIEVNKEFKLHDLKETVISMEYFQNRPIAAECLRIRDKLSNMYFGKIYRDNQNTKTLKQMGIKDKTHIVAQLLDSPEVLEEDTFVLLFARRDVAARTYSNKIECKF
jgi:hypothetical protein